MEVRPGYRRTAAGVIPEDWEARPFVGVVQSYIDYRGRTPRKLGMSWGGGDILALSANNVQMGRIDVTKEANLASEQLYKRWMVHGDCEPGDVLLTMEAPLGNVAQIPDAKKYLLSQRVLLIKPVARVHRDFLAQVMGGPAFQEQLALNATGSTAKGIQRSRLETVPIALPQDPSEQGRIARALTDTGALIESLEQLLAKKRHLKQSAMQELLTGKKRLPGFAGAKRVASEIGDVPEAWCVTEIGEIADVKTGPFGSSLHERDYVAAGTPIITVEHLGERGILHDNLPLVSEGDRKRLSSYHLEDGDIVFSRVGSVDRNARVGKREAGWLFSGRLLRLRARRDAVDTRYLSYQFHSEPFKQRVRTVAVGQTMASLNTQILKGVLVALPTLKEQAAIAAVLVDIDAEIDALEAKVTKARHVKQGMMQELLTGRIRLV